MACVTQTWPHCVNQMEKTQSKPLVAWHGRGMAWDRHGMCKLAFKLLYSLSGFSGLVVSMLASSTRVRGLKPGRSRRIFSGEKILNLAFLWKWK
jgi:hypothetical protein